MRCWAGSLAVLLFASHAIVATEPDVTTATDAPWELPPAGRVGARTCTRACLVADADARDGAAAAGGGVLFVHMSKAGGTSLIRYLRRLVCARVLAQPRTWVTETVPLRDAWLEANASALTLVTALRDPVERAISSYWCGRAHSALRREFALFSALDAVSVGGPVRVPS